ncbi:MAG: hypothetical protein Q8T08_01860 [Ignavibacteria bacterium]|nr:hypothetical protein [Ignavibacteria bacterium]
MYIQIHRSDNRNTRRAKKSLKQKLNSIKKEKRKEIRRYPKKIKNIKKRQFISSPVIYNPEVQNFCDQNKIEKWKIPPSKIDLDSEFSLYKSPAKVLRTLLNILYLAKTKSKYVTLSYKGYVSFGAIYFIDTICWQIASKKRWYLKHNLPEKEKQLLSNLKSIKSNTSDSEYAYVINNRIRINREEDDLAKQTFKIKSKEIRDLIIQGIRENDSSYILPHEGHTAIDSAISEHFDNILLHVPEAEYGFLCGYFDRSAKEITLLIYNFGHTIANSLDNKKLPKHVQPAVDEIILNHTKKSLLWGKSFTKENALTLLAIQEGISSKLDADISRGHGLIDYIEHCFKLSQHSKVVIISGKTAIRVDSNYSVVNANVLGRQRRIIAFNNENDIFEKPDGNNVINLTVNFPGVIIETTIPLNSI